jgi:DivIVA domain-containing protein
MELTPRLLTEVEFREQWRGYSQNEVDEFLERVAAAVAELLERLHQANERATTAERRLLERAEDDEIRRTLVLAQRTASQALEEAQAEAQRIVGEAEARKASMDAEIAERTERELGDILERRRALEADVAALAAYVDELRGTVRAELQRQLDALDSLRVPAPPSVTEIAEIEDEPADPQPAPAGSHPPREAPLTAPRAPTDDEVAQARADLVEALRRAGVDARAASPEDEGASGGHAAEPGGPASEPTGVYDALADEDGDDQEVAWADALPADDDPFLAELRRAVTDTEPLGPRDENDPPLQFHEPEDESPGGRFRLRRGR